MMGTMKFNAAMAVGVRPDTNGYLRGTARVMAPGVYPYDNGVMEWIPEEEVFSDHALASMANLPLVLPSGHDRKLSPLDVGPVTCGSISNPRRDGEWVVADICISTEEGIRCVDGGGFAELSMSYSSMDINVPGVTPEGLKYDVKQTRLDCNHIALVSRARIGSAARVMKLNRSSRAMKTLTIKGREHEVTEEVFEHVSELSTQATAAQSISQKFNRASDEAMVKDGKIATLSTRITEMEKELSDLRASVGIEVLDRVSLATELATRNQKFNAASAGALDGQQLREELIAAYVGPENARKFAGRTARELDLVLEGIRHKDGASLKLNRASDGFARAATKGDLNYMESSSQSQFEALPSHEDFVDKKRSKKSTTIL